MNKFKKTLAACLVAQFVCGYAYAAEDTDSTSSNDSFSQPQSVILDKSSKLTITGEIGTGGMANGDVDFYEFHVLQGQTLSFDLQANFENARIAVYESAGRFLIADNISTDGSNVEVTTPSEGLYIVGVTAKPLTFNGGDSGALDDENATNTMNLGAPPAGGSYTLNITGAAPEAGSVDINIDVKPGQGDTRSQGAIPVALLSSPAFKPMTVVRDSLRFGQKGTENSLIKCNRFGADLNHDGELDLICHFNASKAGFGRDSEVGIVTGKVNDTAGGSEIKGHGSLKAKKAK